MAALVESRWAPIKWAQRKDTVYVTISLPDVSDEKFDVTPEKLSFTGSSEGKKYAVELQFFKEIVPEESQWNVLPRSVQMCLKKKEESEPDEGWPRLLQDKAQEKTNVTTEAPG